MGLDSIGQDVKKMQIYLTVLKKPVYNLRLR